MSASGAFVMPAEWEPHAATWIAWPHHESDFPGKLDAVRWAYAEIVRALVRGGEFVEIACHDDDVLADALNRLDRNGVAPDACRTHLIANDRSWMRDSAPTAVRDAGGNLHWVAWRFNAWAKYDNWQQDARVPARVAAQTGIPVIPPTWPDDTPVVLEGGAIETDGEGTLLVTEECLLSETVQARNRGRTRSDYEAMFAETLGVTKVLWLGGGCVGDDTHGHIDDIARFVAPGRIALACEADASDANYASSQDNLTRLADAHDARGRSLEIVRLPYPRAVMFEGERLPASYANFYIANRAVLVPTFNDPNDRVALNCLADCFPRREIIGISAVDLVWGMGTLHCLTQQQP